MTNHDQWFRRFIPRPDADLQMVCFPHAGASAASYRSWAHELPNWIEVVAVQYPGRADRVAEPPHTTMTVLADALADALAELTSRPYALFGHSMGAAIVYETALRLHANHRADPLRVVVSGREAPHYSHRGTVHRRGREALLAELDRFGGTAPHVLHDDELRELILRTMAADCELIETYQPATNAPRLHCPVSAVMGEQDPHLTQAEVAGWAAVTRSSFDLKVFPGDHFFLIPQQRRILDYLVHLLVDA